MAEQSKIRRKHAVVIGGGSAGMPAAAAVRDRVDSVEIVEAHELPH